MSPSPLSQPLPLTSPSPITLSLYLFGSSLLVAVRWLRAHGLSTERARQAGALRFARGFKESACRIQGFSTERVRLAGAFHFARGFEKSACYRLGYRYFFPKYPQF